MTLLELLVQELPKRGGWPNCACVAKSYSHIPDAIFWDDNGITVPFHSLSRLPIGDYCVNREQYEAALEAEPAKEYLPEVGTQCEFINHGVNYKSHWVGVIILAYGDEKVFMRHAASKNEFAETLAALEFRPIRTEAERKREEVGLALYHAINWNAEGELVGPSRMEDYRKAYDAIAAGKIPGIKLAD